VNSVQRDSSKKDSLHHGHTMIMVDYEQMYHTVVEMCCTQNPDDVLRLLVERVRQTLKTDAAYVSVNQVFGLGNRAYINAWSGLRTDKLLRLSGPPVHGIARYVYENNEPIYIRRYLEDERIDHDYRELMREEGLISFLAFPLRLQGAVQGSLFAANRYEHEFSERQYRTLEVFSETAAAALSIAGLITRLERQNKALLEFGEERDRLAGKLHESVLQIFYSIGLHAATMQPGTNDSALNEICRLTNYGMKEVRFLMSESEIYEQLEPGLEEALSKLIKNVLSVSNLSSTIIIDPRSYSIPTDVQKIIYQVTHELILNIIKHAHASEVTVKFEINDYEICLAVIDDGKGRASQILAKCEESSEHFGLRWVQKVIRLKGGTVHITDNPGKGIAINVIIPDTERHAVPEANSAEIAL
jgi:two-component system, NarL family, sensor kinase